MKHAFLIIAHNEYPVLEVLLSMLDDERNDIYLHIDKRATELFQQIKKVKMQKAGFYEFCIYNHRTTKTNQKYPSVNL